MLRQKSISLLLVFLTAVACYAAPSSSITPNQTLRRRIEEQALKQQQSFLLAVSNGNLEYIRANASEKNLLGKDKFDNNCFHLAKDVKTLQTLASKLRGLNLTEKIVELKNQRNSFGETPLMRHINEGNPTSFWLLYKGSDLDNAVNRFNSLGASSPILLMVQEETIEISKDGSKRTVAQAAIANQDVAGMDKVISFFAEKAPFLF